MGSELGRALCGLLCAKAPLQPRRQDKSTFRRPGQQAPASCCQAVAGIFSHRCRPSSCVGNKAWKAFPHKVGPCSCMGFQVEAQRQPARYKKKQIRLLPSMTAALVRVWSSSYLLKLTTRKPIKAGYEVRYQDLLRWRSSAELAWGVPGKCQHQQLQHVFGLLQSKAPQEERKLDPCWATEHPHRASRPPQPARHFSTSSAPSPDVSKHLAHRRAWAQSLGGLSVGCCAPKLLCSPGAKTNPPSAGQAKRPQRVAAKLPLGFSRTCPSSAPALGMWLWRAFGEKVGPGRLGGLFRILLPKRQLHIVPVGLSTN